VARRKGRGGEVSWVIWGGPQGGSGRGAGSQKTGAEARTGLGLLAEQGEEGRAVRGLGRGVFQPWGAQGWRLIGPVNQRAIDEGSEVEKGFTG